jgi:FAD/FMN-containing dehydrogenase
MSDAWTNWSGAITSRPVAFERPHDEAAIAAVVARAAREGRVVRPLGSGHSSSGLCATDGVLVSLERWSGVESVDPTSGCVTVRAGSVLHDLGAGLLGHGLALENLGDIDRQTLAGALATGTHGTGRALGNLASRVRGLRLVTATGDVRTLDASQPELAGARVSLGALGVVSAVTLQALPAYRLHERVRRISLAEVLATFASEAARHRHFECFYFPRHDFAEAKSLDPTVADPESVEGREGERIGWSADILPSVRELKFHEMEYSVPEASGVACFGALAARLRERHSGVAWPLEIRTVAADDAWLSPAHGRATCAISVHQDGRKPHAEVFADLEPIFWEHGGRPHWGKWHRCDASRLAPLYPRWKDFVALREHFDPGERFLNEHLRGLLLPSPAAR